MAWSNAARMAATLIRKLHSDRVLPYLNEPPRDPNVPKSDAVRYKKRK